MTLHARSVEALAPPAGQEPDEIILASRSLGANMLSTEIAVPEMHCGACMRRVEMTLEALDGVESARANLSARRVTVNWHRSQTSPPMLQALEKVGYAAHLCDNEDLKEDDNLRIMVRAMAVSGFAAANIMLLSVSVWAGADASTRLLFHTISGIIAFPTILYAGRIFFSSAWNALSHGRTNMDVPISIGVMLAFCLSVYETVIDGEHAYFDASVTLLFFLLIGRTLDHMMRERAREAVSGLARLSPRGANVINADGKTEYVPVAAIKPGMVIALSRGERVPVDGEVLEGRSEVDCSLVTGESLPVAVERESVLHAGVINLAAPLTMKATATADSSLIAEIVRLMEAAEAGRSGYRRIADRASQLYAPAVHLLALLTFIAWMALGASIHTSITVAIAVLIVTCPCALGLAVPMVQVVAARRFFERGILLKDGAALERLAEIDTVVFDKTGTLTVGAPRLMELGTLDPEYLVIAARMAAHSSHPYSVAIASAANAGRLAADSLKELPGLGMEAEIDGELYRLGRPSWALGETSSAVNVSGYNSVLSKDGRFLQGYAFSDRLREHARPTIVALKERGLRVEILSGDRSAAVSALAGQLEVDYLGDVSPAAKVAHIQELRRAGRKVLMVGDGLNDAAALVEAHASMAPATAADIGRNAADMVFMHESLEAVASAHAIAVGAAKLVRNNLALAIIYNVIAVPVAMLGFLTPLLASLAMSSSSIIVSANALRLGGAKVTRKARRA